jgi:hypothetical protein
MEATQISTHVVDALARLIDQYRKKARIRGIVTSGAQQAQDLEDALISIRDLSSVYDAEGAQLDGVGDIVDLKRPTGMADAAYRILVLAKIVQNVSGGEPESIIGVAKLMTSAARVRFIELFPAAFELKIEADVPDDLGSLITDSVKKTAAAGVRLVDITIVGADSFRFGTGNIGARGYGNKGETGVGGKFASFIGNVGNEDEQGGDDMPSKHTLVEFANEASVDVDVSAFLMNAQRCHIEVLDVTDEYKTSDFVVSRPNTSTVRLTAGVAITKTLRVLIVEVSN